MKSLGCKLGDKLKKVTAMKYAEMLDCMRSAACSIRDLHELTGLAESSIRDHIRALREVDPQLVYVADWDEDSLGRQVSAKFRLNFDGLSRDVSKRGAKRQRDRRSKLRRDKRAALAMINITAGRIVDGRKLKRNKDADELAIS